MPKKTPDSLVLLKYLTPPSDSGKLVTYKRSNTKWFRLPHLLVTFKAQADLGKYEQIESLLSFNFLWVFKKFIINLNYIPILYALYYYK